MDPQSPNKLIATKYCFLILGDDTSFFFFIFFFFFLLLLLFYVIINFLMRLHEMAEIQARSQPPIFFRQVKDGDRRCQSDLGILWRQNWWERSWC